MFLKEGNYFICVPYIDYNYSWCELGGVYGSTFCCYSFQGGSKKVIKNLQKKIERQALIRLQAESFACQADAQKAIDAFLKKNHYLKITSLEFVENFHYSRKGRPKRDEPASKITYSVHVSVYSDLEIIQKEIKCLGFFTLAANQLDDNALPATEVLNEYKGQNKVERGFKFLKSSEFFADSFYLKTTARIQALLIDGDDPIPYGIFGIAISNSTSFAKKKEAFVENQFGKPVQNPTARWIFQIFCGIHVLYINYQENIVLNLVQKHFHVLSFLGEPYIQIYQNNYCPPPTYRHPLWG